MIKMFEIKYFTFWIILGTCTRSIVAPTDNMGKNVVKCERKSCQRSCVDKNPEAVKKGLEVLGLCDKNNPNLCICYVEDDIFGPYYRGNIGTSWVNIRTTVFPPQIFEDEEADRKTPITC